MWALQKSMYCKNYSTDSGELNFGMFYYIFARAEMRKDDIEFSRKRTKWVSKFSISSYMKMLEPCDLVPFFRPADRRHVLIYPTLKIQRFVIAAIQEHLKLKPTPCYSIRNLGKVELLLINIWHHNNAGYRVHSTISLNKDKWANMNVEHCANCDE